MVSNENGQVSPITRFLRQIVQTREATHLSDAQLLEQFVSHGDEATFGAVVYRHGPMVWAVCRRVLHNLQDAEDAFQATFLVLVRRAGSIGRPELLGGWLHGVAYRTAVRVRTQSTRWETQESLPEHLLSTEPITDLASRELQLVLDEEVDKLPAKFRAPFVLCCLQDKTYRQAAQQLGWPAGTLSSRLAEARELLRARLVRRGLVLSAGLLGTILGQQSATAAVPSVLLASTVKAATTLATGCAATSVVSIKVAAITEGVLKAMFLNKLQKMTIGVLVLAMFGLAATGLVMHTGIVHGQGPQAQKKPIEGPAKQENENREQSTAKPIDPLKQEVANLKRAVEEYKIALKRAQDRIGQLKHLITQEQEEIAGVLTKINVEKSTVSLTLKGTNFAVIDLPLSSGVKILVKTKGETLDDLKVGMHVSMRVESNDGKSLISVVRERAQEKKEDGSSVESSPIPK